ncbi:SURF1 family protein [Quadrisphaera sp. DSM 44207]|uniref:SURF1 family cytochrome oxidase biogenesis protein n=1 Tax=Quadrisphaera sp. DSM 44207 TaxID=1881057 RepID=UPI00087FB097|nr:SURF1 family protein [Quadrisphaera sp. DSM 44207]SDQ43640.1 Cytochrome oxidase assembly protein ShyY1 [Quadrisphaera sp. DSM 44207]
MLALLHRPQWLRALALTAAVSAACVLLGLWQWDRREERLARIARVQANYAGDPVALRQVLAGPDDRLAADEEWTPVLVRGQYQPEATVLVRNRPLPGAERYGYLVLVPLRLDDGTALLVDRGWIPAGPTGEAPSQVPAPPSGQVSVLARLRPPEPADDRSAPAGQVQRIDLAGSVRTELEAAAAAGPAAAAEGLVTGAYGVLVREDPPPAQAPAPAAAPSRDSGPHLAYTVQWFVFAAGAWVFFGVQLRRSAADPQEPRPSPRPARARRPSDEEHEDALLDAAASRRE